MARPDMPPASSPEPPPPGSTVFLVLLIGLAAISWAAVLVRWCAPLPALTVACWRLLVATTCVSVSTRRMPRLGPWNVAAGALLALHFASWIASLSYVSVAISVVLVCTSPLFTGALAWAWLGERLSALNLAGMVLAAGGAYLMVGTSSQSLSAWKGCSLALLGAAAIAGYFTIGRRRAHEPGWSANLTGVYAAASLVLLVACLATGSPLGGFSGRQWLLLAALGVIPQAIGHTALNWALRHAPASIVSVTVLGEPIGSSVLAYLLLHEEVTGRQFGAACLILLGISMAVRK